MMVRCTLAFLLTIICSQTMADTWIKDDKGCQVHDPYPEPNESVTWSGECRDGLVEGSGILQWTVGGKPTTRIDGNFAHGAQSGNASAIYADGNRYEGNFVDGKFSGKGTFIWANGNRYEGNFVDDKFSGKGTFTWANGGRYEGDFLDGRKTGKGTLTWPSGDRYEGDFLKDKRTGKGSYMSVSGERYEGDFLDDSMTGKGVLTGPNGYRWEGEMIDGQQVKTYRSSGKRENYSINGTYAGSLIPRRDIIGISVPPDKSYSQMTPEEKQIIKSQYASMAEMDEPPYPVNGLKHVYETVRDIEKKLRVSGSLSLFVDIDSKGYATAVEVEKSPDAQMLKAVATLLVLQKYKPAICRGSPCKMQFPFRMEFKQ